MHRKVELAIEYIERNFEEPMTVSELARVVQVTPQHLCFLFRRELRISPKQWLKSLRLQAALDLLSSTTMAIKEVAWTVGYRDASRFMRDFKKAHGLTPAEHRTQVVAVKARALPPPQSSNSLANLNFRYLILFEFAHATGVWWHF